MHNDAVTLRQKWRRGWWLRNFIVNVNMTRWSHLFYSNRLETWQTQCSGCTFFSLFLPCVTAGMWANRPSSLLFNVCQEGSLHRSCQSLSRLLFISFPIFKGLSAPFELHDGSGQHQGIKDLVWKKLSPSSPPWQPLSCRHHVRLTFTFMFCNL